MPLSFLVRRIGRGLGKRRSQARSFDGLERLEGRALLATINASAVISSTPAGAVFNDTIALTNAGSSNSGIGTFWYAWVPGEDFLDSRPITVTPPPGWTDNITNDGPGDGFAIQFIADSPADDVQPGASMNFSFQSADPPASINGDSAAHPGTPVGTSFVYPQAPFSDPGHEFVVTASPTTPNPPTPAPPTPPIPVPTPPTPVQPVKVIGVKEVKNKRHQVTEIIVTFDGALDPAEADHVANFRLTSANRKGSFTAKNSPVIKLRSASFDASSNSITIIPKKAFAFTQTVELTINGSSPSGLQDATGQWIDGNGDGIAGGNSVALIRRTGVVFKS